MRIRNLLTGTLGYIGLFNYRHMHKFHAQAETPEWLRFKGEVFAKQIEVRTAQHPAARTPAARDSRRSE